MKKEKLLLCSLVIFGLFFYGSVGANTADHIVISQIQIDSIAGTGGTEDDWVELYNPTAEAVDLTGWSIQKTSKTGGSLYRKELTGTIPAYGYFLIVRNHDKTTQSLKASANVLGAGSSFSLSDDNTIYLVNDNEDISGSADESIVDMVGIGEAQNFEAAAFENPVDGGSIERNPGSGGGNGSDTNSNSTDFFHQSSPHPRNSTSAIEQPVVEETESEPPSSPPSPESTLATGFTISISEIMVNPEGSDSGSEWVELFNFGSDQIDLSGWIVDDSSETNKPGSSAYKLGDEVKINSLEYLVITIPKGRFALNNSGGDSVRLFDSEENLRLEESYVGDAAQGFSYAVNSQGFWEWTEDITPGEKNSFAILNVYSKKLRISEVHPNPEGSDEEGEFIEIHNYSEDSVDLAGWVVEDSRKRFTISEDDFFDTEIAEDGFFVIYREVSGISLNNSGSEVVILSNPNQEKVSEIEFDAKGQGANSFSWNKTSYQWTLKATPGLENEIVLPKKEEPKRTPTKSTGSPEDDESIDENEIDSTEQTEEIVEVALSEVRQMEQGEFLLTSGVVVVPPGVLEEKVLYLQGSGIRVLLSNLPNFIFSVGDLIQFEGEIGSFHNELQLVVNDTQTVKVLDQGLAVEPMMVSSGEIGEGLEGSLVTISGTLTQNQGQTIFVDDGTGEARILIRDSSGITKPSMRKGNQLQVTGVVSQFNNNYRILPRFQDDIRVGSVKSAKTLPRTGSNFWLILAVFEAVILIFFLLFGLIKGKSLLE